MFIARSFYLRTPAPTIGFTLANCFDVFELTSRKLRPRLCLYGLIIDRQRHRIAERSDACATRSLAAMQKGQRRPDPAKDKELVALERSA